MFSDEPDSEATNVEINFLHYASDGYWDFLKNEDIKIVDLKFVFCGPATPLSTSKIGCRFGKEEKKAMDIYKLIKNSNWKACLLPWKCYLWVII